MGKAHDITKEEFLSAYNKYPPNWWTKLVYKYFSQETEAKDLKIAQSVTITLLVLFLAGFIGTVFGLPEAIVKFATLIFAGILVLLVGGLFIGVKMNNSRLKKVYKELDIDAKWGNILADKFLYSEEEN